MALVNQPAILPGAFAAEGDKNTIPANNDGLSGLASIAKGFPQITQVPLAQGGQPPQRQDFNGIFNLFSQFLLYAQNGGVYAYNNTLDYQPPAIIAYNNVFYQCVAENGPSTSAGVQPVSNTTYWEKLIPDVAVMKGASGSAAGASGLVPTPGAGENDEFLRGDGTWQPVVQKVNGVAADGAGNVNVDTFAETDITANADLNNFMDDGFYVAVTSDIFNTIQNKPENGAFYLQVVRGKLTTQRYQILFNISTNTIWTRTNMLGSNWGVWVKLAKETEVALPVGTILPFAGGSIPSGFLACNGAAVSRTTYSALFAAIGTTYGSGDGSTTFNLPAVEDNRFLEFSSTAGTANSAGLPNLTGEFDLPKRFNAGEDNSLDAGYIFNLSNNAFALSAQTNKAQYTQYGVTVVGTTRFTLNAANSNAIYGGSTTVQPKSLTVRAIIKY